MFYESWRIYKDLIDNIMTNLTCPSLKELYAKGKNAFNMIKSKITIKIKTIRKIIK